MTSACYLGNDEILRSSVQLNEIVYSVSHSGEAYMKLNQLQEGKKYFKRSTELTKNELPNIDLARLYLLDDMVPEARNAYTAALK